MTYRSYFVSRAFWNALTGRVFWGLFLPKTVDVIWRRMRVIICKLEGSTRN